MNGGGAVGGSTQEVESPWCREASEMVGKVGPCRFHEPPAVR